MDLTYTSLPEWARTPPTGEHAFPGLKARSYVLVGVGEEGRAVVASWQREMDAPCEVVLAADGAGAARQVQATLATQLVGVRMGIAGPSGACLVVRGAAVRAGLADDEMYVAVTSGGDSEVFCCHCGATTTTQAQPEEVIVCSGCGLDLLVYYHVSRRSGQYLGFQVDAEAPLSAAVQGVAS